MVILISYLFNQLGDFPMYVLDLGIISRAHPLQVTEAQDIQIFMLCVQAFHFFVFQVGGIREAHRTPPGATLRRLPLDTGTSLDSTFARFLQGEMEYKIDIRQSSLSDKR